MMMTLASPTAMILSIGAEDLVFAVAMIHWIHSWTFS